uniref:nucleolar protein 9-like n=1 Tax=Styela clava TaxID=7725 RepID=UPI00193AADAE|nr:nucleolar protein 9-like [Styela clava]
MGLEEDSHRSMMSYLRQADETFRNGFETEEMKQIFLKNTFEGISGSEISFCMQKSFSFVLEQMIKESEFETVLNFYFTIKNDWLQIANNQAGCHVLQAAAECLVRSLPKSKTLSTDVADKLSSFNDIIDISAESLCSVMEGIHSTHALRSHVQMLGGFVLSRTKASSKTKEVKLPKENVPKGYLKTLQTICRCLCEINKQKFVTYLSNPHVGPFISCLFEVVSKRDVPKTLRRLCKKIMSCSEGDTAKTTLLLLIKDKLASHVLETVLEFGTEDAKKEICDLLFEDNKRFFDLCAHPAANFVIQRLITSAKNDVEFNKIFEFISCGLEDILAGQNYGIVQKLCEQCVQFTDSQKTFWDKLLEAFHCEDANQRTFVVLFLASLKTCDAYYKSDTQEEKLIPPIEKVEYHGSILLQTLLKFKNVGLIVKSMCEISIENIITLSCDSSGSHFIDAFYASDKVKPKKKKEFVEKIGKELVSLACDKYGSRVLENIWDNSDIVIKRLIAGNLAQNSPQLSANDYGKFILKKFDIKNFTTRLQEWEQFQKKKSNKRKLFAGIASGTKHQKKKKINSFSNH